MGTVREERTLFRKWRVLGTATGSRTIHAEEIGLIKNGNVYHILNE